jgi:hypothetical protein
MTGGLLDKLLDPVFMAELAARGELIEHLAAWSGMTKDQAQEWLDENDRHAMAMFSVDSKWRPEVH